MIGYLFKIWLYPLILISIIPFIISLFYAGGFIKIGLFGKMLIPLSIFVLGLQYSFIQFIIFFLFATTVFDRVSSVTSAKSLLTVLSSFLILLSDFVLVKLNYIESNDIYVYIVLIFEMLVIWLVPIKFNSTTINSR